ncbi:MAG: hypothetical protein FWD29_07910 [Micrococcales bacterium]|nr:hypothetical protein [Micrococcales bacterium]
MRRVKAKAAAAAAIATAVVMTMAGCAASVETIKDPKFTPEPRCAKAAEISRQDVDKALEQVNSDPDTAGVRFESVAGGYALRLGNDFDHDTGKAVPDPAVLAKALAKPLNCADVEVVITDLAFAPAVPLLGLAKVDALLKVTQEEATANPLALVALGRIENATSLTINGDLPPGQLPMMQSLVTLTAYSEKLEDPQWANIASRLPALASLSLKIHPDADWQPEDLAGLTNLKDLNICISVDGKCALEGVSTETLDLITKIPETLPNLETLNDLDPGSVDQKKLVPGGTMTREERRIEAEYKATSSDLSAWMDTTINAGWATAGNANHIAGPIVVSSDDGDSIANGVRGKDWNGIPAAKLCKDKDTCKSIAVVSLRPGAVSGNYVPSSGSGTGFSGHLGETIVTIYDIAGKAVRPPAVVATTSPPDTVYSQDEAIGAIDLAAAYGWIAAHVG